MGTRGLTVIVNNNECVASKYHQWDCYPSGQGSEILYFLQNKLNVDSLKTNLNKIIDIDNNILERLWVSIGKDPDAISVDFELSSKFEKIYPELHRSTSSGQYLKRIIDKNIEKIYNDPSEINFAADSLFCEWCYVINLDSGTFEIYEGFNKDILDETERFHYLSNLDEEFQPVKHSITYEMHSLPTLEKFIFDLEGCDEGDGE